LGETVFRMSLLSSVKRGVCAAIAASWQKKPICLVQVITVQRLRRPRDLRDFRPHVRAPSTTTFAPVGVRW
jgi:hypothetical protein